MNTDFRSYLVDVRRRRSGRRLGRQGVVVGQGPGLYLGSRRLFDGIRRDDLVLQRPGLQAGPGQVGRQRDLHGVGQQARLGSQDLGLRTDRRPGLPGLKSKRKKQHVKLKTPI